MPRVSDILPQEEILAQLAEEATELAQAALKLRRAMGRVGNPTSASFEEALEHLHEEMADVIVCENQVYGIDWGVIDKICYSKRGRWEGRLEAGGAVG